MSTDLMTYLDYMLTRETQTDENINKVINEQLLFASLGDFDSETAVESEFTTLTDLAKDVRDATIAADVIDMAADAAALASFWSFGLSMAAFAYLEAIALIDRATISSKASDLNAKLATVDTDISAKINPSVNSYITQYKDNNNLISTNMPKGLDTRTARALLMQFLAKVHMDTGALTVANVRKYAEVARILFNSDEIKDVYNALDQLSLSAKSEDDVQKLVDTITGFTFGGSVAIKIVQGLAVAIMFKRLGVANETIQKTAKAAGLEVEEVESSGFGMMDGIGKFATGVAIVMSVVQVVMDIIDIVDVVERTQTMFDKLNGEIKESYQTYFNGIRDASKAYNAAINASGSTKQ